MKSGYLKLLFENINWIILENGRTVFVWLEVWK